MSRGPEDSVIEEIEAMIKQVAGVISCQVFGGEQGDEIEEIHVLADISRQAKNIVRDVETICRAQFGTLIDYRKISIVQLADTESLVPRVVHTRISLEAVRVSLARNMLDVEVELQWDNELQVGSARGMKKREGQLRVVADATLDAIKKFPLSRNMNFIVEDIVIERISGQDAVVVLVSLMDGMLERKCLGSSFVKTHEFEAAARSILDALNRHLGWRIPEQTRLRMG